MNSLEDKVITSLRETAEEIAPHHVPPLRLADGHRIRNAWHTRRHRMSPWLTPLAAATAVAAVVVASVVIAGAIGGHRPAQHAAGQASPFAGLPAYYVSIHADKPSEWAHQAIVRATRTGAVVATLTPPAPYRMWMQASASGNGHDFVLEAATGRVFHQNGGTDVLPGRSKFFLLHVGHGGHPATLTALSLPVALGKVDSFALSPDASRLALSWRGGDRGPGPAIGIVNLATKSVQTWTWPGGPFITNNAGGNGEILSWTTDGRTLAFQQWQGNNIDVRLLDTQTHGGSLEADSKLGYQFANQAETWRYVNGKIANAFFGYSAIITGDGRGIVAATGSTTKHPLNSSLQFTVFQPFTGKVLRQLYPWRLPGLYGGQVQDVLWSNPSGSKLIVVAHPADAKPVKEPHSSNSAAYRVILGVVNGKHFTALPGAPSLNGPGAWPVW
jgi:hypothetical protein